MLDLGRADAEGKRAERAVRRGVGIAADQGQAGLSEPLFRADDMHDALADVEEVEKRQIEFLRVLFEQFDLDAGFLVLDPVGAALGGDVMVGDQKMGVLHPHRPVGFAKTVERLCAGDFVNDLAVDIDDAGAVILFLDQVGVPDFIEQCLRFGHVS